MRRWLAPLFAAMLLAAMTTVAMADDAIPEIEDSVEDQGELADKQLQRTKSLATYFAMILPPAPAGDDAGDDVSDDAMGPCSTGEPGAAETLDEDATALCQVLVDLRTGDEKVGWGAMYKLLLLAQGNDVSLTELLAEYAATDEGWGFGKAFKELREGDDPDWRGDTPKNLGQFKKQERDDKANPERGPKKKDR